MKAGRSHCEGVADTSTSFIRLVLVRSLLGRLNAGSLPPLFTTGFAADQLTDIMSPVRSELEGAAVESLRKPNRYLGLSNRRRKGSTRLQ